MRGGKFCIDCIHSRLEGEYRCLRTAKATLDLVTGEPRTVGTVLCRIEREDHPTTLRCGVLGRFYDPKDTDNAD